MSLKPQDILILLKLICLNRTNWSYNQVALDLGMSPAEVHAGIKRSLAAGLAIQTKDGISPASTSLEEFLIHGLKYVFSPSLGSMTRGFPTGIAASPLKENFASTNEPPFVWPDSNGITRGLALSPLYKSVPKAIRRNSALYEFLVLVDAIRIGRARERSMAIQELKKRLLEYTRSTKRK